MQHSRLKPPGALRHIRFLNLYVNALCLQSKTKSSCHRRQESVVVYQYRLLNIRCSQHTLVRLLLPLHPQADRSVGVAGPSLPPSRPGTVNCGHGVRRARPRGDKPRCSR